MVRRPSATKPCPSTSGERADRPKHQERHYGRFKRAVLYVRRGEQLDHGATGRCGDDESCDGSKYDFEEARHCLRCIEVRGCCCAAQRRRSAGAVGGRMQRPVKAKSVTRNLQHIQLLA